MPRVMIGFIGLLLLLQGCSSKYMQNVKKFFHKEEPQQQTVVVSSPPRKSGYKKIKKRKKRKKKEVLFPITKKMAHPIPLKAVQIFTTPKIPKNCKVDGWLSFYIPNGIVYKSALLPDIIKAKERENNLIRKIAAQNGIRYIYNYLDIKKMRHTSLYDPILKRKFEVIITPTKRIMVEKNRIYREAVRILQCKLYKKGE